MISQFTTKMPVKKLIKISALWICPERSGRIGRSISYKCRYDGSKCRLFNFLSHMNLTNLTDLGLTAFIDHRHPKGILVTPPNAWAGLNWHYHPYRTLSGKWWLGKTGPTQKYHYPRKYRMWYFVSTALKKYPSHMQLVWGSMDPEEGVRTVRYGPYVDLGSA